jgi:hypothetical protein
LTGISISQRHLATNTEKGEEKKKRKGKGKRKFEKESNK